MRKCKTCDTKLISKQRLYCNLSCKNKFYYDNSIKASPEAQYKAHLRLSSLRSNARTRLLEPPTITKTKIIELLKPQKCTYCSAYGTMTIDRKDSSQTYTDDNCVPCCARCNRIKSNDITYDDMKKLTNYLGW